MTRPDPSPADLLAAAPAVLGGGGEGLLTAAGEVAREAFTEHDPAAGEWDADAEECAALLFVIAEAHGPGAARRLAAEAAEAASR
ncbi:hypothetical protein F1C76_13235 [Geodermatophilaceae bacterium NBWT11]|nr:hypothetical protein F1C76_13235 [Geodermatophilaceae bacterium NBWT11]